MSNQSSKKVDFAKELSELESIVAWFESGKGDIDESLEKFERGMELSAHLKKHLETVENKVEVIRKKFDKPSSNGDNADITTDTPKELFG